MSTVYFSVRILGKDGYSERRIHSNDVSISSAIEWLNKHHTCATVSPFYDKCNCDYQLCSKVPDLARLICI